MKNTKTIKTILFASLIAAMILPFSGMNFADAENDKLRNDMKSIHDMIKNSDESDKKALIAEYKLKNQELNTSLYKTPDRDFVGEWQVLEKQYMSITDQQFAAEKELDSIQKSGNALEQQTAKQAEINTLSTKAQQIRNQIDDLQSESIAFMKMNFVEESRINEVVTTLHAKYENTVSGFVMAGIDYEQKKMIVELTSEFDNSVEFENSSVAIAEEIRILVGPENVIIKFDNIQLSACAHYLNTCSPRIGGIAIARYNDQSNLAGSIGYKATYNSNTGYVTAGHVVDFYTNGNRKMIQNVGSGNLISDGTNMPFTKVASQGDVSFQKTSVSINNDIYYSPNTIVDVVAYATAANQHQGGMYVYKMGSGNGLTYGYLTQYFSVTNVWGTNASCATGDSGGPIFQVIGSSGGVYTAKVFGHAYACNGGAIYQPTEKMVANYGIYPALT